MESALEGSRPISRLSRASRIPLVLTLTVLICGFLDQKAFNYLEQYTYNLRMAVYTAHDRAAVRAAQQRTVLVTMSGESVGDLTF